MATNAKWDQLRAPLRLEMIYGDESKTPATQLWGIGLLDQLLWSELIEPDETETVLEGVARHENEAVRNRVEFIRSYLRDRRRNSE